MNTKALRQKILDLAIHGKLVPQDPNDEPASVLLERIRAEKERLIKEGKIKRPKKTKVTSDKPHYENVPFEVPSSWVWCELGSVNEIARGGSPRPIKNYLTDAANGINWIKIGDTKKNGKYIDSVKEKIIPGGVKKSRMVHKGDFLLTNSMSFGRPYILNVDGCIHDGWLVISPLGKVYTSDFLYYLLSSSFAFEQFTNIASGGVVTNLNSDKVANTKFPLPPYEEQKRIVLEIEHWFALIDIIEHSNANLQANIKLAKSKVLDLAIHGKLVPQDPTDEPATELLKRINPKAEITCDNGHYQKLPEGWCECSFDDIFNITMGQSPNGCSINHQQGVEFHQGKILFGDKYLKQSEMFTDAPTKLATPNSLLLCVRAPVGVVNITQREICIGRGLCSLKPNAAINLDYAYHALTTYQSDFETKSTGSTFKAISGSIIRNEVFALPPLEEQHRIVAKIEELFALLDTIKAQL